MTRPEILVTVDLSCCPDALDVLRTVGNVTYLPRPDRSLLAESLPRCDAYMGRVHNPIDSQLLDLAPRLKVICSCSAGTDHLDVAAIRGRGIHMISLTTEYELLDPFTATAEMAWTLLLACRRRLPRQFDRVKSGEMWVHPDMPLPEQLSEQTLGIVGYGRLGRMVGEFGRGFRMRVLACDIKPICAPGIEQVDLETLFRTADVISLHVHLREDTRRMINRESIAMMKPGVTIINTARGELIDEDALLEALRSGQVDAAGLDVICNEWDPERAERPLIQYALTHDNLVMSPHVGGLSRTSLAMARRFIADQLARFLTTDPEPVA